MGAPDEIMPQHKRTAVKVAAEHARDRVFPNSAIGELVSRELIAYAEMGYLFGSESQCERLVNEVFRLHENREEAA